MRGRTLTEGPVLSGLLTFCGPVLLALILQALYGAVDLWAVGRFGTTADISAVSTGSQTMQMVIGGITGLSMGVTVLLGRAMGRGDDDGAARAVGASLWVFGLLGAALSLVMVLAAGPIARGMNAPAEALDQTADYIRICGGGTSPLTNSTAVIPVPQISPCAHSGHSHGSSAPKRSSGTANTMASASMVQLMLSGLLCAVFQIISRKK